MKEKITINGIEYQASIPNGKRVVVVVDRGWIFAGDIIRDDDRIVLSRAVWVFRWESVGFAKVVSDPKGSQADIRPMPTNVDLPRDAEIFRLPVSDSWGL